VVMVMVVVAVAAAAVASAVAVSDRAWLNPLITKFEVGDELKVKRFKSHISAADCSISLKFGTKFDHGAADTTNIQCQRVKKNQDHSVT